MGTATGTGNGAALVAMQTIAGTQGPEDLVKQVKAAVDGYNKVAKGTEHVVSVQTILPANVKGMQWRLALAATLARKHGATAIRIGVHGGIVAFCGPQAAVTATQAAMPVWTGSYGTLVSNAPMPANANRVAFQNAFLCGCPAGLQSALKLTAAIAYGVGYLYTFGAPSDGKAYADGSRAAAAAVKTPATRAPKAEPKGTEIEATEVPAA